MGGAAMLAPRPLMSALRVPYTPNPDLVAQQATIDLQFWHQWGGPPNSDALAAMGLSISDAIRLLMLRVADERRLPFEVKAPNAATRKATAELEAGKGKRFASTAALMADLNAGD